MWSSESNEDAYRKEVTQEMARDNQLFIMIFEFNIRSNLPIESIRSSNVDFNWQQYHEEALKK